MMKNYVTPEMMLINLADEDILTLSGGANGVAEAIGYDEFFPTNVG